jgi:hypothetical protein
MRKLVLFCCLSFFSFCGYAQTPDIDADYKREIGGFLDQWHNDAAHARLSYFDKIAPNGVYIGTDKTELWTRDAFKIWARPHFERKQAWTFTAIKRNVYMSEDKKFIWFDELLDTQMGVCQASGVIRRTDQGLKIEHYQLSIAVPNEIANKITNTIKEFEGERAAK